MGIKCLAEAIILQSIADLWTESGREKSIAFLTSDGFKTCADTAGMMVSERVELLKLVSDTIGLSAGLSAGLSSRLSAEIAGNRKKRYKQRREKTKNLFRDPSKTLSTTSW